MTKFSYSIEGVYQVEYCSFDLVDDGVYYVNKEGSLCNKQSEITKGNYMINYVFEHFIYLIEDENRYVYDVCNDKLQKHNSHIYPINEVFNSNKQYCLVYDESESPSLYEFSNFDKGLKIKDNIDPSFIFNDLFYEIYNGFVGLECFDENTTIWQLDILTYFDNPSYIYEGRVLAIDDRLVFFVYTRDWKQYATFVLDANTGEILFTTKEMVSKLFEHNQYIYQIQRKVIKQLNPKTLTVQTIDLEEKLKERGLLLVQEAACFYKNKLYVTARESSSDIYNIWLIIDLESGTIEHQQEMLLNPKRKAKESNKMFISDIKANDKYVVTRCATQLYVFEKEEK